MLSGLNIQNVVLIDRLTLDGSAGLCALTGETGAGKSILLDALGLALGQRAEAGLVRHGADQAAVTAVFEVPAKHPVRDILAARGVEADDSIILRRVVMKDGRSKAYINDAPVSVQLLKETGAALVEITGSSRRKGCWTRPRTDRRSTATRASPPKCPRFPRSGTRGAARKGSSRRRKRASRPRARRKTI